MASAQPGPLDINILPERYRRRRVASWVVVGAAVLAVLLLGLVPAYAFLAAAQQRSADLEARLAQARQALTQTETEPTRLEDVEQQIEQTSARIDHINEAFGMLSQKGAFRSTCVSVPIDTQVTGIQIVDITQDGAVCAVTGMAESEKLALDYARAIRSVGRFANVFVFSLDNADSTVSGITFTIRMEQ